MAARASIKEQLMMWEDLRALQETFPNTPEGFRLFAQVIINTLIAGSPDLNRTQADICDYLLTGPKYRMVQASRGIAKTTLTAIYAVFFIIHQPPARVVIFSRSGSMAAQISGWVIKIFRNVDFLHFMRPDERNGDRSSIDKFDVHWVFRGAGMSPSVSCQSIVAGAQGLRADLLIADDVESLQNARTVSGRELLEDATKEFESINQIGDIIYLGTPQSIESIYNNLPSRGYDIRIWPARYPTESEVKNYGAHLAPMLLQDIKDNPDLQKGGGITGKQGQPTTPEMFPDDILIEKEISQGRAKFQLQYMLNTRLADEGRFPIKLSDIICMPFGIQEGPLMPIWASGATQIINDLPRFGNRNTDKFHMPIQRTYEWQKYDRTVMYIDGAGGGQNDDETAYAVIHLIGTYIYVAAVGGVKGGYEEETLQKLVDVAKKHSAREVFIEKNYGNGAHAAVIRPLFSKTWPVTLEEINESGQKELRIIDVLEPVISSHRFVVSPEVIQSDFDSTAIYPVEKRLQRSLFFQLAHITRDRQSLVRDDRVDALAGAVRQIISVIDYDMEASQARRILETNKAWMNAMNNPAMRRELITGVGTVPQARTNKFG